MRNLPMRKSVYAYTLQRAIQGLVVIGASYVGLQIVTSIFGFVLSAASFILPVGILSAAVYGGWQWLKSR